ncbi:hypothetical protein RKD48_006608 [Streptomyces ambofaciens]
MNAEQFNASHPVGTLVFAYPGFRPEDASDARRLVTRTRTEAQLSASGDPVVWVEGEGSYICLTHVDPVAEDVWEAAREAEKQAEPEAKPATVARLSPERESEIAARAEAATPGPWEANAEYGAHFYAYLGGPYLLGVGTLNFGEGTAAEADKALTVNAREDIRELLAELAAVRAERDQAEARIVQLETERTTLLGVISDAAEQARDDHDRITELERPAVEAKRNEIRASFTSTIAQAQEDRDHEGAFALECQLREREEQWKRKDEAAT